MTIGIIGAGRIGGTAAKLFNALGAKVIAYDIKRTTGSDLGIAINGLAGYGSEEANKKGMAGLMNASLFTGLFNNPWFGGGCCGGGFPMMGGFMTGPTYMSSGIVGGMYNGVPLPSMRVTPYFGSGMSVFQNNGFFA